MESTMALRPVGGGLNGSSFFAAAVKIRQPSRFRRLWFSDSRRVADRMMLALRQRRGEPLERGAEYSTEVYLLRRWFSMCPSKRRARFRSHALDAEWVGAGALSSFAAELPF